MGCKERKIIYKKGKAQRGVKNNMSIRKTNKLGKFDRKEELICYSLILPQIIGFLVFTLYPILWTAKYSWFSYNGIASETRCVGWQNFIDLFTRDPLYWKTWLTTLEYTLIKIPLELPVTLFIAILLNKQIRGKGFYRAAYFMPTMVSGAIIAVIFTNMFSFQGLFNNWLLKAGINPIDWFGDKKLSALFVMALASSWNTFGTNVLYFIAALSNVPNDVYEAANIDGAGRLRIFFSVTLPMIAPVVSTILLLSLNGTLHTNDFVLMMTGGAPRGETFTVMSYITDSFVPGFADTGANIGYGSCMSLVTSILMVAFAFGYTRLKNKLDNVY